VYNGHKYKLAVPLGKHKPATELSVTLSEVKPKVAQFFFLILVGHGLSQASLFWIVEHAGLSRHIVTPNPTQQAQGSRQINPKSTPAGLLGSQQERKTAALPYCHFLFSKRGTFG